MSSFSVKPAERKEVAKTISSLATSEKEARDLAIDFGYTYSAAASRFSGITPESRREVLISIVEAGLNFAYSAEVTIKSGPLEVTLAGTCGAHIFYRVYAVSHPSQL